eukprot:TRINITY_DN5931_c0_g1_i1.p3 TRINITY_DN5931_c0_g1~~TRINITY_DN5931_c0_g1_i1.p3  ORF type:complete len:109 (-),score=7.19 TRINITY_DN5931_c0_g1_i1:212-514(-)
MPLTRVGNCDETPVYFGYEQKSTIAVRGVKQVSFKKAEGARKRVTVLLGILASGEKLAPLLIFKGERKIKNINTYGRAFVEVQANAWCDAKLFNYWLRKC